MHCQFSTITKQNKQAVFITVYQRLREARSVRRKATQYLIRSYGNFRVRRGSQHAWSPRFPDFTALHFYFSLCMKMPY